MWTQQQLPAPNANNNDPFENVPKNKAYDIVSREYLLPSKESRCLSKRYLTDVQLGNVFRVRVHDILEFELHLTVEQKLKSTWFNLGVLKDKGDALLQLLGRPPFGFHSDNKPDEQWLTRVLRYIDPHNILRAFRHRVPQVPPPMILPMRMYDSSNLVCLPKRLSRPRPSTLR